MLAAISDATTRIKNLLMGDDVLRTIEAFQAMGVEITPFGGGVIVQGVGMHGLKNPRRPLYLGNSGTTMRILPGILAGQDFEAVLKGDKSLSKRPMLRIAQPLRRMGVNVAGSRNTEIYPPLKIRGGKLKAIKYKSKIASAQVKSCILMAGLFAQGVTSVSEPVKSRDHTERMLRQFGVKCRTKGARSMVWGPAELRSPRIIEIPNDISSAAFFIVAGCILPGVRIVLKNVGLNPTRTGILDILKRMKADIRTTGRERTITRLRSGQADHEPSGDIVVNSSRLKGVTISPGEVVRAIDEIPIIMVAACFAKGKTVIRGVGELRLKETDRINSMVTNLRKMGAEISSSISKQNVVINGGRPLHGAEVSSFGDHRTAMSMLAAGLAVKERVRVTGLDCINKSFPGFENILKRLAVGQ